MIGPFVEIEVDGEELNAIFEELRAAEDTVKACIPAFRGKSLNNSI